MGCCMPKNMLFVCASPFTLRFTRLWHSGDIKTASNVLETGSGFMFLNREILSAPNPNECKLLHVLTAYSSLILCKAASITMLLTLHQLSRDIKRQDYFYSQYCR